MTTTTSTYTSTFTQEPSSGCVSGPANVDYDGYRSSYTVYCNQVFNGASESSGFFQTLASSFSQCLNYGTVTTPALIQYQKGSGVCVVYFEGTPGIGPTPDNGWDSAQIM